MTYVVKTVRLRGVSPALDGLKAQIRYEPHSSSALAEVTWLNGAFLTDCAMFVSLNYVEDALPEVTEDELATDNPYGSFMWEDSWENDETKLSWARYAKALTTSLTSLRNGRVMHAATFVGDAKIMEALKVITSMRIDGDFSPVDFSFEAERINRGA